MMGRGSESEPGDRKKSGTSNKPTEHTLLLLDPLCPLLSRSGCLMDVQNVFIMTFVSGENWRGRKNS